MVARTSLTTEVHSAAQKMLTTQQDYVIATSIISVKSLVNGCVLSLSQQSAIVSTRLADTTQALYWRGSLRSKSLLHRLLHSSCIA